MAQKIQKDFNFKIVRFYEKKLLFSVMYSHKKLREMTSLNFMQISIAT